MTNTNYIGAIVKITETPKQKLMNNGVLITKFRAQLPQVRNTTIVYLSFWGNLARDIALYYKLNDYILIEGYVSLRDKTNQKQRSKKVEITVLKAYPFLLNYNSTTNKL